MSTYGICLLFLTKRIRQEKIEDGIVEQNLLVDYSKSQNNILCWFEHKILFCYLIQNYLTQNLTFRYN